MYTYRIFDVRVIDGDTIECTIDMGFYVFRRERIRFNGIDTPEINSNDITVREKAKAAKEFVEYYFKNTPVAYVRTKKADLFGRWLGTIYDYVEAATKDEWPESLNSALLEEGHATPYSKL